MPAGGARSTTRRGNGAGLQWGGSKRGGESASKTGTPGPGRGITGKTVAEIMAAAGAREISAERWMAILNDPTHPKHADMIAKAADRLDGAPVQDVTSKGERLGYVIAAPAESEDADAWARQHQPK